MVLLVAVDLLLLPVKKVFMEVYHLLVLLVVQVKRVLKV